jgi:hypothetical protein
MLDAPPGPINPCPHCHFDSFGSVLDLAIQPLSRLSYQSEEIQAQSRTMIPNWQIAVLAVLVLIALAGGIYVSPNSYAHAFLWGECAREPAPKACHPVGRGFGMRGAP